MERREEDREVVTGAVSIPLRDTGLLLPRRGEGGTELRSGAIV